MKRIIDLDTLMLYNFVMYGKLVVRIEELSRPKQIASISTPHMAYTASVRQLEPMIISQEFLKINGFTYGPSEFGTLCEENVWSIEDKKKQFRCELEYQETDEGQEYYIITANAGANSQTLYTDEVHRLQNVFTILGVHKIWNRQTN